MSEERENALKREINRLRVIARELDETGAELEYLVDMLGLRDRVIEYTPNIVKEIVIAVQDLLASLHEQKQRAYEDDGTGIEIREVESLATSQPPEDKAKDWEDALRSLPLESELGKECRDMLRITKCVGIFNSPYADVVKAFRR